MVDPKLVLVYIAVALAVFAGNGVKRGWNAIFHRPGPEIQTSTTITAEWRSLMPEYHQANCRDVGWFVQKNTKPDNFMRVLCPTDGVRGLHREDLHFVRGTREKEGHVAVRKVWKD